MSVRSYRDLIAWQKAMDVAEATFRLTARFPKDAGFVLTSQMRRAALSVPSNIAEGQGRGATKEYIRYLRIARGSVQELETQLLLAQRLGLVSVTDIDRLVQAAMEVGRIISGLMRSLNSLPNTGFKLDPSS
jgi:four helix bundle protein